jgi:UTP-glucose-1-phosphate uridylyltransferase/mevalonate kinase
MKLFVPGRICLFGEHSDWAGAYRRINADLHKGRTIICGTNQGAYAEVRPHPSKLILRSTLDDGRTEQCELPMERAALLAEAEAGRFFSYAAGVAFQVLTHYRVGGLEIDNYRTDLPVKKGLSSSAAICVLVARGFNRTYDLKMTTRGEMEFAYLGEITTPSRCGRMDQGCAYGNRPVVMTFDGDRIDVTELKVPRSLYFVIVDLQASKDTRKILADLNRAYPFADTELHRSVQEYLGQINSRITDQAMEALVAADAARIGALMRTAQAEFDRHLAPACPTQLAAPVLHKVLNYGPIQPHILGGKGVGSQGDGTAQFIVPDEAAQAAVVEILQRDLQMPCLTLVIEAGRRVRKAVVPAAGFGTRLFPASKMMKKEMFPVIDRDGRAKPVILAIIEEALSAGIDEIGAIIQPDDRRFFEEFFGSPLPIDHLNKLSQENRGYVDYLLDVGRKITWIPQTRQDGFGHAVYCARPWLKDEPFLLLLGDHLYASDTDVSCAQQLLDTYERVGHSVVGLKVTPGSEVHNFGCVSGVWREAGSAPADSRILAISEFCEKPNLDYARAQLRVDGLNEDQFLTVFGMYVLEPQLFDYLAEHIAHNIREHGEFQLTSCLERLRQEHGFSGYVVQGRRFDIGLPEAYRQTVNDFGRSEPRS